MSKEKKTYKPDELYSRIAIHPGEILKDELEAREISKSDAAKGLQVSPQYLSDIFAGRRNFSPAFCVSIENYLKLQAEYWMHLQGDYDITVVRNLKLDKKEKKPAKESVFSRAPHAIAARPK
ncbi:HigA family addiction module antitoxin [Chitinophagaceae bacterium 26-R-25]|nr:HigA family addiction module antitoxin [Chitinophagaceae bacterium 26-R-25]